MFRGEYIHAIDDKGRLIIPAKFREELGTQFFATRGPDNSVYLYPCAEWEKIESQLCALPTAKPKERAFVRLMMSSVTDCEMNAQGRVTLPAQLRSHAFLQKDVMIIGNLRHLELWDCARWEDYKTAQGELEQQSSDLDIRL
jgi:MraZ protein